MSKKIEPKDPAGKAEKGGVLRRVARSVKRRVAGFYGNSDHELKQDFAAVEWR